MHSPPALNSRAVNLQDRLADCEGAVIPDEQEHECELKCTIIDEEVEEGHGQANDVEDELKLLVVILIAHLLSSIQN